LHIATAFMEMLCLKRSPSRYAESSAKSLDFRSRSPFNPLLCSIYFRLWDLHILQVPTYAKLCGGGIPIGPHSQLHPDVRRWMLDVRRSPFDIRPSTFDVRRSTFEVRRSMFDVRRSTFDVHPQHTL
jgi:hypothetical protein